MSHRLSSTVSCDPARRGSQSVDQRGLAKARTQPSHQAQHGHPVSPHSMMSRTEFGDLPNTPFAPSLSASNATMLLAWTSPMSFLQAPTQTCRMEGCIGTLDWHLGDPDIISFDTHLEHRCIIRPQIESAPAAQIEAGVMPGQVSKPSPGSLYLAGIPYEGNDCRARIPDPRASRAAPDGRLRAL